MADSVSAESLTMCDGNLRAWIEQEAVHMKVTDRFGDPVELTKTELQFLAQELLKLADRIQEE